MPARPDAGLGSKQALSYMLEGFMSLTLLMGVVRQRPARHAAGNHPTGLAGQP